MKLEKLEKPRRKLKATRNLQPMGKPQKPRAPDGPVEPIERLAMVRIRVKVTDSAELEIDVSMESTGFGFQGVVLNPRHRLLSAVKQHETFQSLNTKDLHKPSIGEARQNVVFLGDDPKRTHRPKKGHTNDACTPGPEPPILRPKPRPYLSPKSLKTGAKARPPACSCSARNLRLGVNFDSPQNEKPNEGSAFNGFSSLPSRLLVRPLNTEPLNSTLRVLAALNWLLRFLLRQTTQLRKDASRSVRCLGFGVLRFYISSIGAVCFRTPFLISWS